MTAGSRIVAMGHYQPSRVVTNDDLASIVDTNDAWIHDRVGIAERRIADAETVADMATFAAEKALASSGLTAADIDLVIVATCSSIDRCPNVATRVAARLGIAAPAAYDLNTACSGFSYALATADHAIRAGAARNALVIGAEKLSDVTDWTDRTTAVLFGDGAGAAVVTGVADGEQPGIGPVLWGSAPDKGDVLRIEGWQPYIQQEGQTVFRWATTALAPFALAGLRAGRRRARTSSPPSCPHQANTRIIDGIVQAARPRPGRRHRQGHRRVRQHLRGERPAGPVQAGRAPRGALGRPGPALRLRRRPHLRRAGRPLPVSSRPGREQSPPSRGNTSNMATREEITAGLAEILEEVAGVNPDDVAEEKSFTDDLDVDSLSMVEVVVAAEEKFGVKIPDDEVQNLKTVGDAVSYIEANH